jgi:hypothetical protein
MPQRHPEDLPWNDVAADSDTMSTDPEPDPAEVVGGEDDDGEEDLASHRVPDPYEEEPEATLQPAEDAEAGELQAPEAGGDDVDRGEDDPAGPEGEVEDEAAEDAAVHIRKRV